MKKRNLNGMTLVECIIAMCILGAIAGMFVTVAVKAKSKNAETYVRANEMYEQAAAAESFSTETDYGVNVKVSKLLADGTSSNEFNIVADFGSIKLDSKAYGFMARRRDVDTRDTDYQLRFFRSENAEIATPNPAEGEYWVKVYNHSGTELRLQFDAQSGKFYTNSRASLGETVGVVLANENETALGYCIGENSDLFSISDWENPGLIIASFDESNITDYMEVKDGHVTGFIIIHICDGLEVKNQEAFDAG
jgi:type II secretory pathway pseudopilin PulG